jgi:hypothetical protein
LTTLTRRPTQVSAVEQVNGDDRSPQSVSTLPPQRR